MREFINVATSSNFYDVYVDINSRGIDSSASTSVERFNRENIKYLTFEQLRIQFDLTQPQEKLKLKNESQS